MLRYRCTFNIPFWVCMNMQESLATLPLVLLLAHNWWPMVIPALSININEILQLCKWWLFLKRTNQLIVQCMLPDRTRWTFDLGNQQHRYLLKNCLDILYVQKSICCLNILIVFKEMEDQIRCGDRSPQ